MYYRRLTKPQSKSVKRSTSSNSRVKASFCLFEYLAYYFCIVPKKFLKFNDPIGIHGFQNRQHQRNVFTINIASIVQLSSNFTCIPRSKLSRHSFKKKIKYENFRRKNICKAPKFRRKLFG